VHEPPESGGVAGAVGAGESIGAEVSLRVEAPGVAARVPPVGRRATGDFATAAGAVTATASGTAGTVACVSGCCAAGAGEA
jgi:hypothetical protein